MIYDANYVKTAMSARALEFCEQFIPAGRKCNGKEYRASDIRGSQPGGKSFCVIIRGPMAGRWIEYGEPYPGTEKKGHLIDILMAVKGINFPEALKEAKRWLGLREDEPEPFLPRTPKNPTPPVKISTGNLVPAKEGSPAWNYLTKRGIKPEIIKKYGVCDTINPVWFRDKNGKLPAMAFPVRSPDGETVLNIKYIAVERSPEGKKYVSQEAHGTNHLMFMNRIDKNARRLVICEGEIDAMTVASIGLAAVSVPAGAHGDRQDGQPHANNEWLANDYEWLANFEEITLCFDNDQPGEDAVRALFYRLGISRTNIAKIPKVEDCPGIEVKDPNSFLVYCAMEDMDFEEKLQEIFDNTTAPDPETLKRAIKYRQGVYDLMFPSGGVAPGRDLPNCSFGDHFKIRDGEITVWTGFGGHGKSEFLNDLTVCLCAEYGDKACIGSFEIPPARTLYSMGRQVIGMMRTAEIDDQGHEHEIPGMFDAMMDWLNERMFFYDYIGTAESKKVIAAFEYAAMRYGVKLFIIDSLMCMDVDEEDKQRQKDIMNELREFVIKYNVHMSIVCHSKKPTEKRVEAKYIPGKHDVLGSVHITNLAWNVVVVWRNISKGPRLQEAKIKLDQARDPDDEERLEGEIEKIKCEPDAVVSVRKQRDGTGELPYKELWFDGESKQYRSKPDYPIRDYLQFNAEEV